MDLKHHSQILLYNLSILLGKIPLLSALFSGPQSQLCCVAEPSSKCLFGQGLASLASVLRSGATTVICLLSFST